jgi:hypothetical protein
MQKPSTPTVHTAVEFREIAQQCRLLAQSAQSDAERQQILMLAECWDTLANEREKLDAVE